MPQYVRTEGIVLSTFVDALLTIIYEGRFCFLVQMINNLPCELMFGGKWAIVFKRTICRRWDVQGHDYDTELVVVIKQLSLHPHKAPRTEEFWNLAN